MTISGFGIALVRLQAEHIEMLRQWRNDVRINRHMDFRAHITQEAQQQWFSSLDPVRDFYFLIWHDGDFHGLIHCSAIDWNVGAGQSGLFIKSEAYQGTQLPVCASALMLEYFFTHTSLQMIEAKVMNDNLVALRYNLSLGFTEVVSEHPDRFKRLRLRSDDYYRAFGRQLDLLKRAHGSAINVAD